MEKSSYIRFLVSNSAVGSVIGKGGSTINDFQSQSGAQIQLSRNNEFFPGTTDRIIMVSGTLNDILNAVELILAKLLSELRSKEGDDVELRTKARLVVPHSCCGGLIGKGGSTIKSFIEDSQAGIKISPQDTNYSGLSDRLATLSGSLEQQMRGIYLIISKLSENHRYSQPINSPFAYPVAFNSMTYRQNGTEGKFVTTKEDQNNSMTIAIADDHIGLVVGRFGRNIIGISQVSGAKIEISDRGDFMSGTTDRKVIITGSQRAIRVAESMIMQKVFNAMEMVVD